MSVISTPTRLARPSSVLATAMTARERLAFGTRDIALCVDAREVAHEYASLTLRDRIGARPIPFSGGAIGSLNGKPAVNMDGISGQAGRVTYQMAESYFIATAVDFDAFPLNAALLATTEQTGARLFFGAMATRALRLDHGTSSGLFVTTKEGAVPEGKCILWASYSSATGRAEIGINAVTASAGGFLTANHGARNTLNLWGGGLGQGLDGRGGLLVVTDRYLGGGENAGVREIILGWLAEYADVPLAV